MNLSDQHKRYESLHVLKVWCALAVVMIHCPSSVRGEWFLAFAMLARPLFFMISGFFLSSGGSHVDAAVVGRRFVRVLLFDVGAQVLYFAWRVGCCVYAGDSLAWVCDPKFWLVTLIFGGNLNVALWYVNAYAQALFVIWILAKCGKIDWLYWYLPVGIALYLFFGELCALWNVEIAWIYSRNVVTFGLPCMTLGLLVRRREWQLPSVGVLLVTGAVFLGLFLVEVWANIYLGNFAGSGVLLFGLPVALIIFTLLVKHADAHAPLWLVGLGRRYSANVYVGHTLVGEAVAPFLGWLYGSVGAFVVFGVTLGLSRVYKGGKKLLFNL